MVLKWKNKTLKVSQWQHYTCIYNLNTATGVGAVNAICIYYFLNIGSSYDLKNICETQQKIKSRSIFADKLQEMEECLSMCFEIPYI